MGDSVLKRFWNAIKLPPPTPRREWETELPSLWSRVWSHLKPPPPLSAVPPELARRRRRIFFGAMAGALTATAVAGAIVYVRSAPKRAEAALQEGMRFAAAGDSALAVDSFTRAIGILPQYAPAYLQRGLVRQTLLDSISALQDFEKALELNPKLTAAYVARGTILKSQGNVRRAAAEFTAALAVEQNEDAYYQRGQIYESLGEHEKAIQDYSAAIALLPDAPYVYRARATAELGLGDRGNASRDREQAYAIEHQLTEAQPRR